MLPFLHAAERDGWHYFVTGDESWFSWPVHHAACKFSRDMTWPQRRESTFRAKLMFTIMWNSCGFHVVDKLPNGTKVSS
jgi:hypothetical protein